MSEDGEARFREPKTIYKERELVEKAIPWSTKYKNKKEVTVLANGKFLGWFSSFRFRQEGSLKAMIYTGSHNFLSALKKWMQ